MYADAGHAIANGKKLPKTDPIFELIGSLDELNSFVGLVRVNISNEEVDNLLKIIQDKIFTAGADIGYNKDVKINSADVKFIADMVDQYSKQIEEIHYFVYPTGVQSSALLHVCRSICRRAERNAFAFSNQDVINPEILQYLNKLSSLFFVLARLANKQEGVKDERWGR